MTFRLWPWSEIHWHKRRAEFLESELYRIEAEYGRRWIKMGETANKLTADRDEWIKRATRLRVERDQAKDALAKVQG